MASKRAISIMEFNYIFKQMGYIKKTDDGTRIIYEVEEGLIFTYSLVSKMKGIEIHRKEEYDVYTDSLRSINEIYSVVKEKNRSKKLGDGFFYYPIYTPKLLISFILILRRKYSEKEVNRIIDSIYVEIFKKINKDSVIPKGENNLEIELINNLIRTCDKNILRMDDILRQHSPSFFTAYTEFSVEKTEELIYVEMLKDGILASFKKQLEKDKLWKYQVFMELAEEKVKYEHFKSLKEPEKLIVSIKKVDENILKIKEEFFFELDLITLKIKYSNDGISEKISDKDQIKIVKILDRISLKLISIFGLYEID